MKKKTIIPLVIGIAVLFVTVKLALNRIESARGDTGNTTQIAVATTTIDAATRIEKGMIKMRDMPAALLPPNAMTDPAKLIGRVTRMSIPSGVAINGQMLAPRGAEPGLRARIPPGYLAVSVKVTEASSVAGFLVPGARVDVFATVPSAKYGTVTKRVLANVEIGAVGQSLNEVSLDGKTVRNSKTVTLFLQPEQVPTLQSAERMGQIRLALRGHDDGPGANVDELDLALGDEAPTAEPAPATQPAVEPEPVVEAPPPQIVRPQVIRSAVAPVMAEKHHTVEVRYGSSVQRYEFDANGRLLIGPNQRPAAAAMPPNRPGTTSVSQRTPTMSPKAEPPLNATCSHGVNKKNGSDRCAECDADTSKPS